MKRGLLLTALVSSLTSAPMTAFVLLSLLPSALHAQATPGGQMAMAPVIVTRSDGLAGIIADVRPTGGGVLHVLGTDGKTFRATLGAAGAAPGQSPNPADAGLTIHDLSGNDIARVGTISADIPIAFRLRDAQGKERFLASLDQNGNPSIQLLDASGNIIWSAP